ncbi:MAG TPA: PEP-CTERM sorting domain-containing protein [Tepidisphaeraceae bacterium]|jgi:hypothetical protein
MRPSYVRAFVPIFALMLCCAAAPRAAWAGYTPINPPPFGEDTHQEILSQIYGGTFVPLGLDFTNGTVTATRVEDFTDPGEAKTPLQLVTSFGSDDQLWQSDFRFACAEAKFAVYKQDFGYFDGLTDNTYHKLFDQDGLDYNVTGDADLSSLSGKLLRWGRGGEDRVLSSRPSDNADGRDHMVTYLITGLDEPGTLPSLRSQPPANLKRWLIFFEDKFQGEQGADFDYNDLVVEITATQVAIPEPASAVSVAMLGGFLLARRGRRQQIITPSGRA